MATKKKKTSSGAKKKKTLVKKKVVKRTKPARKTVKKTTKTKGKKQVRKKRETPKKPARAKSTRVSRPAAKPVRKKVKGKGPGTAAGRAPQKKKRPAPKTRVVARKKPAKTPPALTARKEKLRKHLISKREEIVREVKAEIARYTKGDANQLVETALDDGDWSVIDVSADINIRRLETHRERLQGIDEALIKLREGTYGICEECGSEITPERLKVLPFAIYCRDCQEKREQLEKIARKEIVS